MEEVDGVDGSADIISKTFAHQLTPFTKTVEYIQAPVIPCVFTNAETKQDKCIVVLKD